MGEVKFRSENFDKVRNYYRKRLWRSGQVYEAVGAGWITADEYKEITGKEYY